MIQRIALAATIVLLGAACTERTQTIGTGVRSDTAAFQGTGMAYQAQGWKSGDRNSWEQQLKTRTQNGQNDYAKVN